MNLKKMFFASSLLITGCSSTQTVNDPLQNTKKLVKEGHVSLYENGAFQVPSTHLYLIPPAPQPIEIAEDLMGVKAKASFFMALTAAADSVSIVSKGMKQTYSIAGNLSESGTKARKYIQSIMRPGAKLIILKSTTAGKELIGESWDIGKNAGQKVDNASHDLSTIRKGSKKQHEARKEQITKKVDELYASSNKSFAQTKAEFNANIKSISDNWILGYATMDKKISQNVAKYESKKSLERFSDTYQNSETNRKENSNRLYYLIDGGLSEAVPNANKSFTNGKNEITSGAKENGYTLSAVKSIGWFLKGIFWDLGIIPAGKITVGGIGYVVYNYVAYPIMLTSKQGYNTTLLVVEYSQLEIGNGYDYIAPTAEAALAGIIASAKAAAGYSKAGILKASAVTTNIGDTASSATLASIENSSLYVGEKIIHYVGVPMTTAGAITGTATTGAILTGAGYTVGGATYAAGEIAAIGTDVAAKTGAGVVAVAGTTGSVATGASVGVFEVAQSAVVVPALALGSGITITYGAASQIAAQTLLGAADASYLVLSMEGPKFVVYSIKGVVSPKQDLPSGTVIDLDELRRRGEVIKKLPLSDEELKPILESMSKDLPEKK